MRESLEIIGKQFNEFFDFPTEDRSSVTSVSCKLFAEYCVEENNSNIENMSIEELALLKFKIEYEIGNR